MFVPRGTFILRPKSRSSKTKDEKEERIKDSPKNFKSQAMMLGFPLAPLTSFKIGGPADYFFVAKNKKELVKAVKFAQKQRLPFFILGQGTNLLISDQGFRGLVIKCELSKILFSPLKIKAEAGVSLAQCLQFSSKKGLTGLEWSAGIPGSVAGAIYNNAGAFAHSIKEVVQKVKVLNVKDFKIKTISGANCDFGYRQSIFKKHKELIILNVELKLEKGKKEEIKKEIKKYLNQRRRTQPLGLSAGCIFKNPRKRGEMISAGFLIEKCGLKGARLGQAVISQKHANFILNQGQATAQEVRSLIDLIKNKVRKKFGLKLQEEIEYLPC